MFAAVTTHLRGLSKLASDNTLDSFFLLITMLAVLSRIALFGQDANWDLQNYHVFHGWSLSYSRSLELDLVPTDIQSYLNPYASWPAYLLFYNLPFPASAIVLGATQWLVFPLLVLISRSIQKNIEGSALIARQLGLYLSALSPMFWGEVGTSFSSSLTAPLLLASVYLVLKSREQKGSRQLLFIGAGGLLTSLAVTLKLTNAPFALALVVATLFLGRRRVRNLASLAAGAILGGLMNVAWYLSVWQAFGNPIFPLYNSIFQSPYYPLENFRDGRWEFNSFNEFASFPIQAALGTGSYSEVPFGDLRYLLAVILVLAFFLQGSNLKTLARDPLVMFVLSAFAIWAWTFAYLRYWIAGELLVGLMIFILISRLSISDSIRRRIASLATVASLLFLSVPDWGHVSPGPIGNPLSVEVPTELLDRANYLNFHRPSGFLSAHLHPASSFYSPGTSNALDAEILERIIKNPERDVRAIFSSETEYSSIESQLRAFFGSTSIVENCHVITSSVRNYNVCTIELR